MSRYQDSGFWDSWYVDHRDDKGVEWSAPIDDTFLNRVRDVLRSLPQPSGGERLRICELGCGRSTLAVALAGEQVETVGVDFSQEVITQMRDKYPHLRWCCADALRLGQEFEESYFDFVVAKTLLDVFVTRTDSEVAMRRMFEQVRYVLKEEGRFMLLDKASLPQLQGRGSSVERLMVADRPMHIRSLVALPRIGSTTSGVPITQEASEVGGQGNQHRWETTLQLDAGHLSTRRAAGGAVLIVNRADGSASAAGLRTGDRLLGIDAGNAGMCYGEAPKMQTILRQSVVSGTTLRVLVDRPQVGRASRRSTSQEDYLVRQHRARVLQMQSQGRNYSGKASKKSASLPPLDLRRGRQISAAIGILDGLFA